MKTETISKLERMIGELSVMMDTHPTIRIELFEAKCKLEDADIKLRASMGPFAPKQKAR